MPRRRRQPAKTEKRRGSQTQVNRKQSVDLNKRGLKDDGDRKIPEIIEEGDENKARVNADESSSMQVDLIAISEEE